MLKKTLKLNLFEIISLSWITLALAAIILLLLSNFYWLGIEKIVGVEFITEAKNLPRFYLPILILPLAGFIGGIFYLFKYQLKIEIKKMDPIDWSVLISIAIIAGFLSFKTGPTVFGGRDEGSLANAGILIAKNYTLKHRDILTEKFFSVYGPGKALNFPGFYYNKDGSITNQFLPAYPVWLALVFKIFDFFGKGYLGLRLVNFLPFFTFIGSFYFILNKFTEKTGMKIMACFALITSFPVWIFYAFSLTEIFFGALIWTSLHFFLRYLSEKEIEPSFASDIQKNQSKVKIENSPTTEKINTEIVLDNFPKRNFGFLILTVLPLIIAPFERIESLAFIFILILILIIKDFDNIQKRNSQMLLGALIISVALSIVVNVRFFADTAKGFIELPNNTEQSNEAVLGDKNFSFFPDDWKNFYLGKIFFAYNLLPFIILTFGSVGYLLKKKKYLALLPMLLFGVSFIYLIDANISLDHPWMLRRYVFAVIPLLIFYSALFFDKNHIASSQLTGSALKSLLNFLSLSKLDQLIAKKNISLNSTLDNSNNTKHEKISASNSKDFQIKKTDSVFSKNETSEFNSTLSTDDNQNKEKATKNINLEDTQNKLLETQEKSNNKIIKEKNENLTESETFFCRLKTTFLNCNKKINALANKIFQNNSLRKFFIFLNQTQIGIIFWILMIVFNLILIHPALPYRQNDGLFEKVEKISKNFTAKDLVLVSQKSSGSGWSLIAEPMRNFFGINAVYFFNPNDLDKLDLTDFKNVYLITSDKKEELELFKDLPKEEFKTYLLKNEILNPSKNPLKQPEFTHYTTGGIIYKLKID